ncbi:sulfur carrier protein ThiS [Solimonas marina]|uniref:Sulfur carrier protein ThiS n=1 Tax=Solimonas marina TaxID=2714601 RepID=A0A969WEG3_9GAMM|nr:sulfur carrier protein ThiS [Solimonas marina]NKF24528.1 sulfur carrier protein ThiS [Solimonas marina]
MSSAPQIRVNGEPRPLPAAMSISALLQALDLAGRRVAVEVNGDIVPRSRHTEPSLKAGDEILIVQAIGGG